MIDDIFDRIIREKECFSITGLARSTRYRNEKRGIFPRRVQISHGAVGWRLKDVQSWINDPESWKSI